MNESWSLLPEAPLVDQGLSAEFAKHGCQNFREAARLIQELAYGRISKPYEFRAVLEEGRGTCSSKHALISLLSTELALDVQLNLACFDMTEANTPGVGSVLRRHGLDRILEAHVYLVFDGAVVDLTWPKSIEGVDIAYTHETAVAPAQLATKKESYHRSQLDAWKARLSLSLTIEELWSIREECIAALQSGTSYQ